MKRLARVIKRRTNRSTIEHSGWKLNSFFRTTLASLMTNLSFGQVIAQDAPATSDLQVSAAEANASAIKNAPAINPALSDTDASTNPETFFEMMSSLIDQEGLIILSLGLLTILGLSVLYNLITSGKHGWGWIAICVVVTSLMFCSKIAISMFNEMAVSQGPSDWDED